ncbi:long-chain fatty acid--CoA ligase [Hellea sp.]|nr:long-chain fatty acid--CoA ligase [Hellea sp.]MDC1088748.1 long-chain fatty acid--CoA ligase [Hellea sp.]
MIGTMQQSPTNLIDILNHAARWHGEQEIVTYSVEGDIRRSNYSKLHERTAQLAHALTDVGLKAGECLGTLAWNTDRHVETWYATAGLGVICHTINPRLPDAQLVFIINDAADKILFVDLSFVDIVERILPELKTVKQVVVMTDNEHMAGLNSDWICYEDFLDGQSNQYEWVSVDIHTPSSICYTSGTTGDPKGVVYSHYSNLIHTFMSVQKDAFNLGSGDNVLMIVPMFHANSWGLAYALPMVGAKMVLPGPHLGGADVCKLIQDEAVNTSAAVPTVWTMLLNHLSDTGETIPTMKDVIVGGSAVPKSMIETFKSKYDVNIIQAWGMTEMSPLGTLSRGRAIDGEETITDKCRQGRVFFGVDMKIVNDTGDELERDGKVFGRLMVKGPVVVDRYHNKDSSALEDGWFDTGDIATINAKGSMGITDRSKDVIKSGGEWISSVDMENAAISHPSVNLAACIGIYHPKWEERPLLVVMLHPENELDKPAILDVIANDFARWQLPNDIVVIENMPLTGTGKLDKKVLRARFEDHYTRT